MQTIQEPQKKPTLVLASTSPYRRQLLDRFAVAYETARPGIAEERLPGESPRQLALRLAEEKARAVAANYDNALIIGADQVALLGEEEESAPQLLSKPGSHAAAVAQLRAVSGKSVQFLNGLALYHTPSGRCHTIVVPFRVLFRTLEDSLIEAYLRREQPYDCACSFKSEGLGIVLFERMEGEDPTALIGLPLIALRRLLEKEQFAVL
ncbi:Maf family protein [Candidatus Magnetaquicoccus inordinatus]|uniref:Maf family protein n=1 Tax=Candidatus Magnetaquicoccus inordinatus TaxID=2496818 RepID=UPI00102D1A52|nr:Maf family nucleotide pyrophosphatase [Candidatus Magnetaquicoccus inordinatus]